MKKHNSSGILYVFDVKCGYCDERFRTHSEIDEPPRFAECRHCKKMMFDDDDVTYTDERFIGEVEVDLFDFFIVDVRLKK